MDKFWTSLLTVLNAMSPYLLLGFLIAGLLHVFVPRRFYARYLSRDNKWSVLWAALLGIPLPLCSCGVIPTAIGLKNERASKGAVGAFLIATPQTGIDSILATFSLLGLGFAVLRPVAALVTGVCGGLLINLLVKDDSYGVTSDSSCAADSGSRCWRVLRYAYFEMIQDIGLRLCVGLLLAALISVAVPDEFFLAFGSQPLLQMLAILAVAVPMYVCSTGSIPIAAALMMKGLSPGAALVMLMAGPAVNMASILVVRKSLGSRFTAVYLLTIVVFAVIFGLLIGPLGIAAYMPLAMAHDACCASETSSPGGFRIACSCLLVIFIINAMSMKLFSRFKKEEVAADTVVYRVEGMHCNHCKAAVESAVGKIKSVTATEANPAASTLAVTGTAPESAIRAAVEQAGFDFKGKIYMMLVLLLGMVVTTFAQQFKRVAGVSDMQSGMRYIIACGTKSAAAGALSSTYLSKEDVTLKNDVIKNDGSLAVFVVEGSQTDGWTFKNESTNSYLYSTAAKNVGYSSTANTWKLSDGTNGVIMTYSDSSFGTLQYNSSSPRFTTYTSSQTEANLYMEYSGATTTTPELVADPQTLTFVAEAGKTQCKTFDILGADLAEGVTVTLTDADNVFSVSPSAIGKTDAEEGATVTVTFAPAAAGTFDGSVTVASAGADPVTVALSAIAIVRPADYYQKADGKKGAALKTAMCGIIYSRTELGYDDLWTAYRTTDVRSNGKIWDMYSNTTNYDPFSGSHANSAEGSGFNREHSFPKSWFGGEVMPMYTDLHHLYPVDGNINTRRSNNPYGETEGEVYKSANGFSKLGACTRPGYTDKVFEPADEYKGDFARTYFYMVTCYEEKLSDWCTDYGGTTEVDDVLDGNTYPGLSEWQLEMLMNWAKNDPVSEKETTRNNAVYAIQNNRNPFIDYPGLEEYIWGFCAGDNFSYDNYVEPVYANATLTLASSEDNGQAIATAAASGRMYDVTLDGRTLYKDGNWNTLCLPFGMTDDQVTAQLAPTKLMELDTEGTYDNGRQTGLDGTTLYLYFKEAASIDAGKPYIVKWTGGPNLENPAFSGVSISNAPTEVEFTGGKFVGTYSPVGFTADDKTKLFLGDDNTLYWPSADTTVNACHAYFDLAANAVREFKLHFGDGDGSGITDVDADTDYAHRGSAVSNPLRRGWFTVSGVRLDGKPTKKGIYVNNGKKVVIE